MRIIITNHGRKLEERPIAPAAGPAPRGPVIALTDREDQEMLGFGAALTDSACVMLNRMDPEERDALLDEVYSPEKGNFSVARICVGSSDYAEYVYDFAPVKDDMEMEHFDASHDDINILPVLRKVREINPDLYIFSSPWSPPGWMKTSRQMQGGWMRDKYVEAYALYYQKFLQHYLRAGVRINALTPQNESETDQTSSMPACYWHPDIEMHFAKVMRRLLDENEFADVKIWLMDHNFLMWHRVVYEMDDPDTKQAAAGVAWHPYEGHPEQISQFRALHPECENHWTEGGTIPGTYDFRNPGRFDRRWAAYGESFCEAINNGVQSITVWNLALDEEGHPCTGPFECRGTIEISRDGKSVRRSQEYDSLLHLTKYVKRGARRILLEEEALPKNFAAAAFRNPDGTKVVLISNSEDFDSGLNLKVDGQVIPLWILRQSINTVVLD